jgi:hypothetical protein
MRLITYVWFALLGFSACSAALAGGFPVVGTNGSDPYLIMRGPGNACGQGDAVTCVGTNAFTTKRYRYGIEVPPGTGELRIELFDADVGVGIAGGEAAQGRDQNASEYIYTVVAPNGTVQTTRFNRGRSTGTGLFNTVGNADVGCQSGVTGSGDNAWCSLLVVSNPANGHWEVFMEPLANSTQITAVGLRALDSVTNRDLNVYSRATVHYGNQTTNARRSYTIANGNNAMYPYLTAGCGLRTHDFDSDGTTDQQQSFDYLGQSSALSATQTQASVGFSGNDLWNSEVITHSSDTASNRFGIWRAQMFPGAGGNHVQLWFSPDYLTGTGAAVNTENTGFRIYFPTNAGDRPFKPIFRHSVVNVVSGPAVLTVGSTTRIRMGIAFVNNTAYPINFSSGNNVTSTLPASDPDATRGYAGNFTSNCGTLISQPALGGSGSLVWNPGAVAPQATCQATYEIDIQPISVGRHLLTSPTATGTIGNALDETGTPIQYGPLCEVALQTGTDYTSVPVTLGMVNSSAVAGSVNVQFETISEVGSTHFELIDAGGSEQKLHAAIPAQARGDHTAQSYALTARMPKSGAFYIDQVENHGKRLRFGPFQVGARLGEPLQRSSIPWKQLQFSDQARAKSTSSHAELTVTQSGLYRVSFEELSAAGVNLAGNAADLALTLDGTAIARKVSNQTWGPGAHLEFYADVPKQALHGQALTYRLRSVPNAGKAWQLDPMPAANITASSATQWHTSKLDSNREYGIGSALQDPWILATVMRSGQTPGRHIEKINLHFQPVANQSAQLHVQGWGGLDFEGNTPEHVMDVFVNGTRVGGVSFDGINALSQIFDVPAGLLRLGSNEVRFDMPVTAYPSGRINLDSIELRAQGAVSAAKGGWRLPAASADIEICAQPCAWKLASEWNASWRVLRLHNGEVFEVQGVRADANGTQIPTGMAGEYRSVGVAKTVRVRAAAQPARLDAAVQYAIIAHPSLMAPLQAYAEQRRSQGLNTAIIDVEGIYSAVDAARATPDAIQKFLRQNRSPALKYVLLVGSDSYDYDNVLGLKSLTFMPTAYRPAHPLIRHTPTDVPLADSNDDGQLDLAIGRWPVRSVAEVQNIVRKTLRFNPSATRSVVVSDRVVNNYDFKAQQQQIHANSTFGGVQKLLSLADYSNDNAGVTAARADLQRAVNEGVKFVSFFGHASPYQWSASGFLRASDVRQGLFTTEAQPFIAFSSSCWSSYYVLPEHNSLAHELLTAPGGAAALIGASALSETGPATAYGRLLTQRIDQSARLGDAWREALNDLRTRNPLGNDVYLGTVLLGDPTLPLR